MPRSPYGAYFTLRSRRQRMIAAMRMRLLICTIFILNITNIEIIKHILSILLYTVAYTTFKFEEHFNLVLCAGG